MLLDYLPHGDEGMREQQADLWLGFEEAELGEKLRSAGLEVVDGRPIPGAFHPEGPDANLPWFAWVAVKT